MAQYAFGSGTLYGTRSDIANGSPIRFGVLQDVNIEFDGDVKMLYGQNQFPVDVARGKTKITGKAKYAEISSVTFNNLFFGMSTTTGQTNVADQEAGTVPSATTYTITTANAATWVGDLGVTDGTTGQPLTFTSGTPTATGQYTVAAGVYTFSAADAGKPMLISYLYTTNTGITINGNNPLMGTTPKWSAVFSNSYAGKQLTLRLYSCVSGKLSMPTKQDDYVINELDFDAFANAAGQTFSLGMSS